MEDRDFHEWVRGEVVPALRHRKNFEVQGEYTPGAAAALKGSIRELQLALEQQRRELELALLSRGEALHEALRALAERRKSMYPLMDAVAACRSVAEPTVLFGSAHYASAKWPPPERRANYAEAKDWTPASAFLKGKLEPRAAARCLHVFEAVIYARMCATHDERGFKYVSHNCRVAPLYDERILQETFAECRAHFEDAGGGDNWRVSAAAFWQGRTWRHAQAARWPLCASPRLSWPRTGARSQTWRSRTSCTGPCSAPSNEGSAWPPTRGRTSGMASSENVRHPFCQREQSGSARGEACSRAC